MGLFREERDGGGSDVGPVGVRVLRDRVIKSANDDRHCGDDPGKRAAESLGSD